MAKRNVIEDSDDEDEDSKSPPTAALSFPTEPSEGSLVNVRSSHAATASNNSLSIDVSTGSTGRELMFLCLPDQCSLCADVLNREIRCAHKRLVEATSDDTEPSTTQYHLSQRPLTTPNMSKQRRKRALSNVESPSPRIKRMMWTKGCKKGRDPFDFHGSSDGEIEMDLSKDEKGVIDMPPPSAKSALKDQLRSSGLIMSTITDPLSTESMLLEGVPAPSKSSKITRSLDTPLLEGKMPTSTAPFRGGSDEAKTSNMDQTPQDLRSSAIAGLQTQPVLDTQENPSSSASFVSPSKSIMVEKATGRIMQLQWGDIKDELSQSAVSNTAGTNEPIVLLPQRPSGPESPDPISHEPRSDSTDNVHTIRIRDRTASRQSITEELSSDDISIGMPKEQYQPRLSRSRAGHNSGELLTPVDFSKKPETVAKAAVKRKSKSKIKRSKTTAFQELRPPSYEEEDKEEAFVSEEMDWEKATEIDGLANPQPHTIAENVEDENAVKEGLAQKPTKKRGRPRKATTAAEDDSSARAAQENMERGLVREEPKTFNQARRIHMDGARDEMIVAEECEDVSHRDSEKESTPGIVAAEGHKVLEQSTSNSKIVKRLDDATKPASNLCGTIVSPDTPRKPAKALETGPDKHSPISSSKVAYRVGLSKRARIEPLLRVVRK